MGSTPDRFGPGRWTAAVAALLATLATAPLAAVDFTSRSGGSEIVYRLTPRTGTLNDLQVTVDGGEPFHPAEWGGITAFQLAGRRLAPWDGAHASELVDETASAGAWSGTFRWSLEGDRFEFTLEVRLVGPTLVARFASASDRVLEFDLDRSRGTPGARIVELPYGHNVLFTRGVFISALLDPRFSNASQIFPTRLHVSPAAAAFGPAALYRSRTDGRRSPLRESVRLTVSPRIEETFHRPPNPVSPHRRRLSRMVVADLWGRESFASDLEGLRFLAAEGLEDVLVLLHVWQRYGYDNGLPSTFPASRAKGGEAGLRAIADFCRERGYLFGLHTNYVDFYPNSDDWEPADVALDPEARSIPAWFNPQAGVQSFLMKPSRALAYARAHEPVLRRRYRTSAAFLDVHSAILPSMKVDFDAGVSGAARQETTFRHYRSLAAYLRGVHRGPLAGEGKGYSASTWAGYVDGMEADPRSFYQDLERRRGTEVPTLVDYKLRVLHPLFVPHGAGYLIRFYSRKATFSRGELDRYMATELAFGNAAFFDNAYLREPHREQVGRKYRFMRPLQERYLAGQAAEIGYLVDGEWRELSDALRLVLPETTPVTVDAVLSERLGIVRVRYLPDLMLTVNRSRGRAVEIEAGGAAYTLRPSDFLALAAGRAIAYAAEVDGVRTDFVCDACAAPPAAGPFAPGGER